MCNVEEEGAGTADGREVETEEMGGVSEDSKVACLSSLCGRCLLLVVQRRKKLEQE